jgi:hypothetical protein
MAMTRWSVVVSEETDKTLRVFLAEQGGGKKGDLSAFIEDAVKSRLFELTVKQIKEQNLGTDQQIILDTIEDAVRGVRANRT